MGDRQTRYSDTEKIKALKRHLLEGVAVSVICDEMGVAPSVFYKWQTRLFETADFSTQGSKKQTVSKREDERVRLLEERLRLREEALAELMADHVALKKRSIGLA